MSSPTFWSLQVMRSAVVPSLAAILSLQSTVAQTQTAQPKVSEKPFVVEYYYKARWGMADEFIRLFKKNHYPLLKKQLELGRALEVTAASPLYHGTEDGRWDYRVTIVWKNAMVAHDDFDFEPITKQLYPDQEVFKREERTRFETLLAHWDLSIASVNLEKK